VETEAPRVAVVIVSHNTRAELLRCLASLVVSTSRPLEILVVDNASQDGSPDAVERSFPQVRVMRLAENVGFARANNHGLRETEAPLVLMLNPDTEVRPRAVDALAAALEARPRLGAVGPRTLNPDGSVQVSFGPDLTPLAEWRQRRLVRGVKRRNPRALARVAALTQRDFEPDWLSGSCILARREALLAVGGFDEGFFLYEEDADLGLRLRRAGWRLLLTPGAEIVHHLGASMAKTRNRARLEYQRSHLRYYRKHNGPASRMALRCLLASSALLGLARAVLSGEGDQRQHHLVVLRLALGLDRTPNRAEPR